MSIRHGNANLLHLLVFNTICASENCATDQSLGPGVPNSDIVLYVTAVEIDGCGPSSATVAFASSCTMDQHDRPGKL